MKGTLAAVCFSLSLAGTAWAQPSDPALVQILDNATFVGGPSPLSYAAIFGVGFTEVNAVSGDLPLSNEFEGIRVTFNGVPVSVLAVSPMQLAVQLPATMTMSAALGSNGAPRQTTGLSQVRVEAPQGISNPIEVEIREFSPGIWTPTQNGLGQGWVLFANTNIVAAPASRDTEFRTTFGLGGSRPAIAGDLLTIYANGLGAVDPEIRGGHTSCDAVPELGIAQGGPCIGDFSNLGAIRRTRTKPRIFVGGVEVPEEDVLFSGLAPAFVGLYQVSFRMPPGVAAGDATVIQIIIGDETSPDAVTIATG